MRPDFISFHPLRAFLASGILWTGLLALPLIGSAGPAATPGSTPTSPPKGGGINRDIEVTVPPKPTARSVDPLRSGPKLSSKQAEARRHKCARAAYIVKQGNDLKDESPLAVRYFQQALDLCPGHPEATFRLGVISYNQKKTDAAIEAFKNVIKSDPRFTDAYYNLAIIYRQQKNKEQARKFFLATLKQDPNDALANYNLGVMQYLAIDRGNALLSFQKAVAAKPDMPEPHFFIGALFQERGQRDSAKNQLRKSIKLNPRLTLPRVYLSAILEAEGKGRAAERELLKAIEINPVSVNVGYGVEEFYFRESKWNQIVSHMRMRRVEVAKKPKGDLKPDRKEAAAKPAPPKPKAAMAKSSKKAPPKSQAQAEKKPGASKKPAPKKKITAKAKKDFGTRREAREIPVAKQAKKKTAPKKKKAARTFFHKVRRGDTLAKIAKRYGTTAKILIGLNRDTIEHPLVIEIGDKVRVPGERPSSKKAMRPAQKSFSLYHVNRGDTLRKIAKKHQTTVKTLMKLNKSLIEHPDLLEVGTKLRVPSPPQKKMKAKQKKTSKPRKMQAMK